ncbi:MAG: glucosyl-dolichyl phosphate glucuronosyltransferase [Haloarculaceae archaeon]
MRVSVVVCEHSLDRYADVREAAESVLGQTHDDVELVLVSDGNAVVCERFREGYGDREDVVIHCNDSNVGLLESRNNGARAASGDVVAFLDDDAVADERWLERLVAVYEERDVPAVGGRIVGEWVAGRPVFLPAEFYFLVGVTHRGFGPGGDPDAAGEVRNTNGSNLSFRREVFLDLGGFDTDIGGRTGDSNLQGGETELCARLRAASGHGVYYVPDATVGHKVFEYRTDLRWLLDRAFWQGYSKRGMELLVPDSTGEESAFLKRLLVEFFPDRVASAVRRPSRERVAKAVMLVVFTAAVGFGYGYGLLKYNALTGGPGE